MRPGETLAKRLAKASYAEVAAAERKIPRDWLAVMSGLDMVTHFRSMRLGCSVISTAARHTWYPVWNVNDNVAAYELRYGGEGSRSAYNQRCLDRAARTRKPHLGSYRGFHDLFVPIVRSRYVTGFVVCGPFLLAPMTASDIASRWQAITGKAADGADPELLGYANAALQTPVLPKPLLLGQVREIVELARIFSEPSSVAGTRARWHKLERRHFYRQFYGEMWEIADGLVDPVRCGVWSAAFRTWHREHIGLLRLPTVVLALAPVADRDRTALEEMVQAQWFVELCTRAALETENTACGGASSSVSHLVTYCDPSLPSAAARRAIHRLVERLRSSLHRLGSSRIRVGVSSITAAPSGLPRRHGEAVRALDWAVHSGEEIVLYEDEAAKQAGSGPTRFRSLADLTRALGERDSHALVLAVERLVGDAVWQSGGSTAAARAYVETCYAQAALAAENTGLLEPRVMTDCVARFAHDLGEARSVHQAAAAFGRHVAALAGALRRPRAMSRDSKVARALEYVEAHLGEHVSLAQAAKIAGYAPRHFSRLLAHIHGRSFEPHVAALRIARACELLTRTDLAVAKIAYRSGFRSLAHFYRAFERAHGVTPAAFRRDAPKYRRGTTKVPVR